MPEIKAQLVAVADFRSFGLTLTEVGEWSRAALAAGASPDAYVRASDNREGHAENICLIQVAVPKKIN